MNYFIMPGLKERPKYTPLIRRKDVILKAVTSYFDTNMDDLRIKSRKRTRVNARYIAMYYLYTATSMSYADIADEFAPAVTDHSTVIHGVNFVRSQMSMKQDNEIKGHIENIFI